MRLRRWGVGLGIGVLALSTGVPVFALTSSSENYQMTEIEFGGGSNLESCSEEYCARTSIGDVESGRTTAGESTAEFGEITEDEPLLEVIVDPGDSDLGILTTERTATKTSVIRVRNYESSGYILQLAGDPPQFEGHTLKTPSLPTSSMPGTEQFAINLAANTLPEIGAAPTQVPSIETSLGQATDTYSTPNLFAHNPGDVIGRSQRESGRTDYTISMIINIANSTPAGHYTGDFAAMVVPVY